MASLVSLVPRLSLGTQCLAGSACWQSRDREAEPPGQSIPRQSLGTSCCQRGPSPRRSSLALFRVALSSQPDALSEEFFRSTTPSLTRASCWQGRDNLCQLGRAARGLVNNWFCVAPLSDDPRWWSAHIFACRANHVGEFRIRNSPVLRKDAAPFLGTSRAIGKNDVSRVV